MNSTIDKIIHLVEIRAFEKAAKNKPLTHGVRVMKIYDTRSLEANRDNPCDEAKTGAIIEKWSREKGHDSFSELITSLILLASGIKSYEGKKRIEPTKLDQNILEIKDCGRRLRLLAFFDRDQLIIIAGHYQKHGKLAFEEKRLQDGAIQRAIARRELYMNAIKVETDIYRTLKKEKKK